MRIPGYAVKISVRDAQDGPFGCIRTARNTS